MQRKFFFQISSTKDVGSKLNWKIVSRFLVGTQISNDFQVSSEKAGKNLKTLSFSSFKIRFSHSFFHFPSPIFDWFSPIQLGIWLLK